MELPVVILPLPEKDRFVAHLAAPFNLTAEATTAVGTVSADADPPGPEAVITSLSVEPRSSGVVVYSECVAFAIGAQSSPAESQRCQR